MKTSDPNKQQHHTFGDSPAAERLMEEIDKGANYRTAVRILNKSQAYINDLINSSISDKVRKYFLMLLRENTLKQISECGSDDIIKSLCRNVFVKKIRFILKLRLDRVFPKELAVVASPIIK